MHDILNGLIQGVELLLTGDEATWTIIKLSLRVSCIALFLASILGLPLGAWLALSHFRAHRLLVVLTYTGMGFPPVVIGLFVYLFLSRSGPLGWLNWLFTPNAMIISQTIISFPVISGFTMSALQSLDPALPLQLRALGTTPIQTATTLLWEARWGIIIALIGGFGRIISEVGAVMLVGGNIEGSTRVLTTAIVLETRKGNFEMALALAIVLLSLTFTINTIAFQIQQRL